MIGICLAAGLIHAALPLPSFTLDWMHSIEKIRWEEDYRIEGRRLILTEARILGSGAGMEPPADAVFKDGVYRYRPKLPPLKDLRLTQSPFTKGYELCSAGHCRPLAGYLPGIAKIAVITVTPCKVR